MALRILVAPDAYTGFASSPEVSELISQRLRAAAERRSLSVEIDTQPLGDGGAGTLDVLSRQPGTRRIETWVKDPLGVPVSASYLELADGVHYVEMAQASGLEHLLSGGEEGDRRHPFLASTFGTGELILHALGRGARRLVVGLGGSGTNDGGVGLAQALGVRLLGADRLELQERRREGWGAAALLEATGADFRGLIDPGDLELELAVDVDHRLLGPEGASAVFGPQKGATAEMIPLLEQALQAWADWVAGAGFEDLRDRPGAGAAGGAGFALMTLLRARRIPGFEWVSRRVDLERRLSECDVVVTGEGRVDAGSSRGKVVGEVVRWSRALAGARRIVVLAGSLGEGARLDCDLLVDASEGKHPSLEEIRESGGSRLEAAVEMAVDWLAQPG